MALVVLTRKKLLLDMTIFLGLFWGGRREESTKEEQLYEHSYDDFEAQHDVDVAPRCTEADNGFQNSKRMGRIEIGWSNVLVAGIALGR